MDTAAGRSQGLATLRSRWRTGVICLTAVGAIALAVPAVASRPGGSAAGRPAHGSSPAMTDLERVSAYLGPTAATRVVGFTLGLRQRDPAGLGAFLRTSATVSAAEYARRWGPEPAAVSLLEGRLAGRGLAAHWSAGSPILTVQGSAAAVEDALALRLFEWRAPDGTAYHDADRVAATPAWMGGMATGITGIETYLRPRPLVARDATGYSPAEVRSFYNLDTLAAQGLDGRGETIILPGYKVDDSDLQKYAAMFNLPPFAYSTTGTLPEVDPSVAEETLLDLEAAHSMAPAAKLIVVPNPVFDPTSPGANFIAMNDALVGVGVQGAIVDESYGWCAAAFEPGSAQQLDAVLARGKTLGMTFFVSSGDEGAYGCFRVDEDQHRIATELAAGDPWVTAVGGTSIIAGAGGGYGEEYVWGDPVSAAGGGGGLSPDFPRPDWQKGPGVNNPDSNGHRQIPDVAAIADSATGFTIVQGGKPASCGGTSLAAPVWAGIAALIDQYLVSQKLRRIGFANPALYYFGQNAASLPGPPLHDITAGNNLNYQAGPGWDYGTGWGTPNGGALAAAWADYIRAGGA